LFGDPLAFVFCASFFSGISGSSSGLLPLPLPLGYSLFWIAKGQFSFLAASRPISSYAMLRFSPNPPAIRTSGVLFSPTFFHTPFLVEFVGLPAHTSVLADFEAGHMTGSNLLDLVCSILTFPSAFPSDPPLPDSSQELASAKVSFHSVSRFNIHLHWLFY